MERLRAAGDGGVEGQRSVSGDVPAALVPRERAQGQRDCGEMRMNEWKPLMKVFQGNC